MSPGWTAGSKTLPDSWSEINSEIAPEGRLCAVNELKQCGICELPPLNAGHLGDIPLLSRNGSQTDLSANFDEDVLTIQALEKSYNTVSRIVNAPVCDSQSGSMLHAALWKLAQQFCTWSSFQQGSKQPRGYICGDPSAAPHTDHANAPGPCPEIERLCPEHGEHCFSAGAHP